MRRPAARQYLQTGEPFRLPMQRDDHRNRKLSVRPTCPGLARTTIHLPLNTTSNSHFRLTSTQTGAPRQAQVFQEIDYTRNRSTLGRMMQVISGREGQAEGRIACRTGT
jgi:hypothetical protein